MDKPIFHCTEKRNNTQGANIWLRKYNATGMPIGSLGRGWSAFVRRSGNVQLLLRGELEDRQHHRACLLRASDTPRRVHQCRAWVVPGPPRSRGLQLAPAGCKTSESRYDGRKDLPSTACTRIATRLVEPGGSEDG